jgi:predicted negative regulator of RcsB-dependent stress response
MDPQLELLGLKATVRRLYLLWILSLLALIGFAYFQRTIDPAAHRTAAQFQGEALADQAKIEQLSADLLRNQRDLKNAQADILQLSRDYSNAIGELKRRQGLP